MLMLTSVVFPALGMVALLLIARLEDNLGTRLPRHPATSNPATAPAVPAVTVFIPTAEAVAAVGLDAITPLGHATVGAPA